MGGGGLRILPHKSWHVWNYDNREKVRRDEAQAKIDEAEKRSRAEAADQEARLAMYAVYHISINCMFSIQRANTIYTTPFPELCVSQMRADEVLIEVNFNLFASKDRKYPRILLDESVKIVFLLVLVVSVQSTGVFFTKVLVVTCAVAFEVLSETTLHATPCIYFYYKRLTFFTVLMGIIYRLSLREKAGLPPISQHADGANSRDTSESGVDAKRKRRRIEDPPRRVDGCVSKMWLQLVEYNVLSMCMGEWHCTFG